MKKKPDILVIMSDQHAPGAMGCAGDPLIRTPNLNRLAAEGARFTNAYCPSPLCVPSRMSFMSGRTPSRNRVWTNQATLCSTIPTWAHALSVAGYDTALIGRMHFYGQDQRHGFMQRPIAEGSARHPGSRELGGPRYTRLPMATAGQSRASFEYAGRGHSFYQHYSTEVTDAACDFLRARAESDRPFAAVVGHLLPHCPYIGPKDLFDYYYERVPVVPETGDEPACVKAMQESRHLHPPATRDQLRVARAAYYAMIEFMDRTVGRVLDTLDETGLADGTLVVYCSDHGDMMGEHGLWSKKCFYEQAAGIPLLARFPGITAPGSSCDSLCGLLDLAPTFVELAGAPEMDVDGESLLPVLRGASGSDRVVVSEVAEVNGWPNFESVGRMIRKGPWKLWQHKPIDDRAFAPVLFNLDDDPGEKHNLGAHPDHADTLTALQKEFRKGWDPEWVTDTVNEQMKDWKLLVDWGRTVEPRHPDTYVWPGDETLADLELLSASGES